MTPALLDSARLIIWDLDGTFWHGVLGEEGATFRADMLDVVIDLNKRGIISSIASSNDTAAARAFLELNAAWQYFVFPVIGRHPKNDMVRAILSDTQLRPETAIFLDDIARWRELVAGELPELLGIGTADDFVNAYRSWAGNKPFSDVAMARLHHYKLLERRQVARKTCAPTPEATTEFLRRSEIRCTVTTVSAELVPRIQELVLRTNQLNFTKKRTTAGELEALLRSEAHECAAIHVADRFGDYGVCGFYALEVASQPKLVHFLFSCRILHMGVEAAVYGRLGTPLIEGPAGEVAVDETLKLNAAETDWVSIRHDRLDAPAPAREASRRERMKLTLIGPCELESVGGTIRALCDDYIATDLRVNFVNDKRNVIRHHGHHAFLDLAREPLLSSRHADTLSKLPWFDKKLVDLSFNPDAPPDVVVVSSVRNAQCADYGHKDGGFSVPLDYFRAGGVDFTSRASQEMARDFITWYHGDPGPHFVEWFADQFTFEGPVSATKYGESLEALLCSLPASTHLIMINVTDVSGIALPTAADVDPGLVRAWTGQHGAINAAVRGLNERHPQRTAVIDVNRHLSSADDCWVPHPDDSPLAWAASYRFFETYYHFRRQVYVGMVFDLLDILIQWEQIAIDRETRESLEDMLSDKWWKMLEESQ